MTIPTTASITCELPRTTVQQSVLDAAKQRLGALWYPELRQIACEYHEGVLTLRGIVSSYFMKQMAQSAIQSINGVEEISNRLEVHYPPESLR
jgi:osmotically-inducible protein OsmY